MSKFDVGKEALSYCGKCKLSLGHIIVSMKDPNTIAKVKCNTCGTIHMYRDPSTKAKKVRSKSSSPGTRSKSIPVSELWTEEMGKNKSKPRSYSIRENFEVGDIIDHSKFGPGIVQELIDGKISVLFQHEIKTLVHNK
jgi:hypothetical protein